MRIRLPGLSRRQIIAGAVGFVLVAGLIGWAVAPTPKSYRTTDQMLTVTTGPTDSDRVTLDTTLYLPKSAGADRPVPAILLAHGFGGTKDSVRNDAALYADQGYAVLAWTAQGFGRSTGEIHLDSPDWEVNDARGLIDWLGHRPEVRQDGSDDPRVAVVGGSYGGALALLTAGYDHRVDAIVPEITWNDLGRSLFPDDAAGGSTADGVLKRSWLGDLFQGGLRPGRDASPQCGRFAPDLCAMYQQVLTSGRADAATLALLERSSPKTVLDRIEAPTLLVQGVSDTLFPLAEADANARGIAAAARAPTTTSCGSSTWR
jgi:ABC-2 type transport system ATP-binding protein